MSGITSDGIHLIMKEHLQLYSGYELRIELTRTMLMKVSGAVVRDTRVEFWFEGKTLNAATDRAVAGVKIVDHVNNQGAFIKCLKIDYSNALVAGADALDVTWPAHFIDSIDELTKLRNRHTVLVPLAYSHQGYVRTLEEKIGGYQHHEPGQTLRPFLRTGTDSSQGPDDEDYPEPVTPVEPVYTPVRGWTSLDALHQRGQLDFPKWAPRNTFPDLKTAEVMLTNGRFKWQYTTYLGSRQQDDEK